MEPIFPLELIHKIICLVKNDNAPSSLLSLSYCCKTFSNICRPFIFERIHLGFSNKNIARTLSVLKCLSQNTSYLPYVRSLLVDLRDREQNTQPRTTKDVVDLWGSVMIALPRLDSITLQQDSFSTMPDSTSSVVNKLIAFYISRGTLKSATVDGILEDTQTMDALLSPPSSLLSLTLHNPRFLFYMLAEIVPITSSSNLTTFKVYNPDRFPLHILDRYPNLTHLEMEFNRHYNPGSRLRTLDAPPFSKLRYLSFKALDPNQYSMSLTRDFIRLCDPGLGLPLPRVEHLSLAVSDEDAWVELSTLLGKLRQLRTLEINFILYRPRTGRNPFNVLQIAEHIKSVYTSLQNISLRISLNSTPAQSKKALDNVSSFLVQISEVNVLETFTLDAVFIRDSDKLPPLDSWSTIADCISREDQFPKISKFCFSLNVNCRAKFVLNSSDAQHYVTGFKDTLRERIRRGVEIETSMTFVDVGF
ncbi:hypothetical protein BJ165DRAFT_1535180 [Panaeolus papilionaceus]|nr:hypothetical protein BJ165DRAFT_1535180 [Panaeolus papilionaceus]